MGFNSGFKGLNISYHVSELCPASWLQLYQECEFYSKVEVCSM